MLQLAELLWNAELAQYVVAQISSGLPLSTGIDKPREASCLALFLGPCLFTASLGISLLVSRLSRG